MSLWDVMIVGLAGCHLTRLYVPHHSSVFYLLPATAR